jgi:uncharacterized protein involved in propanediol utilization
MPELLRLAREAGALGVQVAHSGTVAGFLFETGRAGAERAEHARAGLRRLGVDRTWEFSTDLSPHPETLP